MKEHTSEKSNHSLKIIYQRTLLSSFGSSVINPFIHIFAAQMGASSTEIGWVRAINSTSVNIAQIPWGLAVDRLKKRVLFIFLGGLLYAFLLLPLLYVGNIFEFILTITLGSLFSAMVAPALNSLLGDLCKERNRGKVFAQLNAKASIGSIPAILISGYILYRVGGTPREMYTIPVFLGFLFSLSAGFLTLKIKDKSPSKETFTFKGSAKALKTNTYFRRLCFLAVGQGFFLAMAWPIFTLTIVNVIKADMFQISLLSLVSALTGIVVRRFTGRLADRAGRRPLLIIGRGGLFLIPLIYAFASSVYELILVEFVIGIIAASSDVALSAYLLDISPRGLRGSYMGLYNALWGIVTFAGSVIGGYFMDSLVGLSFSVQDSMLIVYGFSIIGRLLGGILYVKLKEPYKYPTNFREELKRMLEEEVKTVDKMAERVRGIEDEDLEWFEKISGSKP